MTLSGAVSRVRPASLVFALLIAVALAACGETAGTVAPIAIGTWDAAGITLVAAGSAHSPDDEVRITLHNNAQGRVGFNLCFEFLKLQRQINQRWEIQAGADLGPPGRGITDCTAPLILLGPGKTAEGSAYLPRDLAPGTYRFAHNVEVDDQRFEIATDGFTVSP